MPSINTCHFIGNLTRNPEIKYTPKGTAICELGLAINRNYTTESGEKREEVTFLDFTAFARSAEVLGEYCHKGTLLYICARASLDQWDDKETGKKRSKVKFIVENFQFLGGAPKGEASQGADALPKEDEDPIPF